MKFKPTAKIILFLFSFAFFQNIIDNKSCCDEGYWTIIKIFQKIYCKLVRQSEDDDYRKDDNDVAHIITANTVRENMNNFDYFWTLGLSTEPNTYYISKRNMRHIEPWKMQQLALNLKQYYEPTISFISIGKPDIR